MGKRSTTTITREAFSTLTAAMDCVYTAANRASTGGVKVELLVGSSQWPDPARRFRVVTTVDSDG